jgi:hypothetical protein
MDNRPLSINEYALRKISPSLLFDKIMANAEEPHSPTEGKLGREYFRHMITAACKMRDAGGITINTDLLLHLLKFETARLFLNSIHVEAVSDELRLHMEYLPTQKDGDAVKGNDNHSPVSAHADFTRFLSDAIKSTSL